MATQVILLERVEKLGNLGDVVAVKPGYARNYLLPQKKALRASKENIAYFEAQKKTIEAQSKDQQKEAEKLAKKIAGLKVPLIRAASESGQLYGSVNTRDIAQGAAKTSGEAITRPMIKINQNFKTIGLFPVNVQLHPEVIVEITVNIARSSEEAQTQATTGRALVADASDEPAYEAANEDTLSEVLEDSALEAEKEKAAEAEIKAAEEAVKAEERAVKKAAKDAAKAAEDAANAENAELSAEAPAKEEEDEE